MASVRLLPASAPSFTLFLLSRSPTHQDLEPQPLLCSALHLARKLSPPRSAPSKRPAASSQHHPDVQLILPQPEICPNRATMALAARSSTLKGAACRPTQRTTQRSVVCRAAGRPMWLPNVTAPSYLDGSLAGDNGFDPLGLGADPARLKWYAEAEKTNGRWAMMAVVGILGTELLGVQPAWWEAGAKDYGVPMAPLTAMEFLIMGFLETKRYQGFKETGTSGLINQFPFDPAGMNSKEMAIKEVKNGRLAMVAFVGFAVQALASRTGPIEGLTKHLANPAGYNVTYTLTHLQDVNTY